MINGAHAIVYSVDADADRIALQTLLGTDTVDAGGGWLIMALPPQKSPSIPPATRPGTSSI